PRPPPWPPRVPSTPLFRPALVEPRGPHHLDDTGPHGGQPRPAHVTEVARQTVLEEEPDPLLGLRGIRETRLAVDTGTRGIVRGDQLQPDQGLPRPRGPVGLLDERLDRRETHDPTIC